MDPNDPVQLRTALFDALQSGDGAAFENLVRDHRRAVEEHFPKWTTVPVEIRQDRAQAHQYVQGIIAVAQHFNDRLGEPALLNRLRGNPQTNPMNRWDAELTEAQKLISQLRHAEAGERLRALLPTFQGHQGSGVINFVVLTLGHLGECYFQLGSAPNAVQTWYQAMQWCSQNQDARGWFFYASNILQAYRYQGQSQDAAGYAEAVAQAYDSQNQPEEAARYRRKAKRLRAGEPLVRAVVQVENQRLELDEISRPVDPESVKIVLERNRPLLQPAAVLTKLGEKLASEGKFDEALEQFRLAGLRDPFDPHSRYQAALAYMLLEKYPEAVASYDETEKLAPGWYTCRSERWLAQEIVRGNVDPEVFFLLRELEDGPDPAEEKLKTVDEALKEDKTFAPLLFQKGKLLRTLQRVREAIQAFRSALASVQEPDLHTQILTQLGLIETGEERTRLLEKARGMNGNLVAAAMAALALE